MSINSDEVLKKLNSYNGFNSKITHTKISNQALNNKFVFFRGFDIVEFPNGIDWNYKHNHTVGTYQIYLHTLSIIRNLTNSFLKTGENKYIIKAKEIINEWHNSKENSSFHPKNASWKDHSAASRMKNIIYFQQNSGEEFKLNDEIFEEILNKHCEFLSKREFYSENNHGMMSDEALLFLSCYLSNSATSNIYSQTAILRMERIILKLFSSSSYNLENSPEYHRLTQRLAKSFIELVDLLNYDFDDKCRAIITKSYERNKVILKPDNTYPLIGDTGLFEAKIKKSFNNFIDYQAGLAIINTKNEKLPHESSYFSFKAGYLLNSHKHQDDLSITYFHRGEDILIDSGKYTYDNKNPKKSYIMSTNAHSTIHKLYESYNLSDVVGDVDKLKMNFVYRNDEFIHIGAMNNLYDNVKIYRDLIYFENIGCVIIDRTFSSEVQFMGQNFNLSPDVKVSKEDQQTYYLTTPKGQKLILQEHTSRTLSKYFSHSNITRGHYSLKFNELLETHQIEFRKNSHSCEFITSLLDSKYMNINDTFIEKNKLHFILNGNEFSINLQSI